MCYPEQPQRKKLTCEDKHDKKSHDEILQLQSLLVTVSACCICQYRVYPLVLLIQQTNEQRRLTPTLCNPMKQ